MLLQLAKPSLTDFLKIAHRSTFFWNLCSIVYFQIFIIKYFFFIPNIDWKCFIIKSKLWFFQCTCQDFPYWRISVPYRSQKVQLFSPPVESPHHNLINHSVFGKTKESNFQNNSSSNFRPTPSKNTPQAKFTTPLKCTVSQLLLTLSWWLHVNEYILQFNKLQTP